MEESRKWLATSHAIRANKKDKVSENESNEDKKNAKDEEVKMNK